LSFVKTDNGAANDTVNMRVAGLYCDVAGITSTKVFTGAYNIDGGTRKFAGAAGTGNIAFSFAGQTLLHADGNILSAK
jgi:hypothetical protein